MSSDSGTAEKIEDMAATQLPHSGRFYFKVALSMSMSKPLLDFSVMGEHLSEKLRPQSEGRNDMFYKYSINIHNIL